MSRRKPERTGPSAETRQGQFGSLSQCIMDVDPKVLARARLRRKAVAASIALQAVCVAALLIWPLIAAPNVLPHSYVVTPVPPYAGTANAQTLRRHVIAHPSRPLFAHPIVFSTPTTHAVIRDQSGELASEPVDSAVDAGIGNGQRGFGIPGIGTAIPTQPARPAPPTQSVVRLSEGVMAGQLIHQVQPNYPQLARDLHLSGAVHLQAIIDTDGTIRDLEIVSGSPILSRAALEAVRQWRYRPTLLNGVPVEVETSITVNFVLSQ
ncbi:MAG: energy transducer TonB [Candidatus Acidiferrales bacterium]